MHKKLSVRNWGQYWNISVVSAIFFTKENSTAKLMKIDAPINLQPYIIH